MWNCVYSLLGGRNQIVTKKEGGDDLTWHVPSKAMLFAPVIIKRVKNRRIEWKELCYI